MHYSHIVNGDNQNLVVFDGSRMRAPIDETHPYWNEILEGVQIGDESVLDLFDLSERAAEKLNNLTDNVSVANGRIFFKGDELSGKLAEQVSEFIRQGVEDWKPLVLFLEKLMTNLNEHTREQLYRWISQQNLTITPNGNFIGYKGVNKQTDGANITYVSVNSGSAYVNGELVNGNIPNQVGSVISMPRNNVEHDPATGCSTGLHAGVWSYARHWGNGAILEVEINPADVVSVPTDCNSQKLRVCKYRVVGITEKPREEAVAVNWGDAVYNTADEYDQRWLSGEEPVYGDLDEDDDYDDDEDDFGSEYQSSFWPL
jgi:hypothetical protein